MLSVGKTVNLLFIAMIASITLTTVNAACVDRQNATSSDSSAVDKVSNFFVEVGCTIKSGAERVKERVESGYNYIKSKITPDDFKNGTIPDKAPQQDDRITFKEEYEENGNAPEMNTVSPMGMNPMPVQLVDRTSLTAPDMCRDGFKRIEGECREVFGPFN